VRIETPFGFAASLTKMMRVKTLVSTTIPPLSLPAGGLAQSRDALKMPTWQDEITKGFAPYHQLTVDDFPINDHVHAEAGFWVEGLSIQVGNFI
jgi:hypothetical protein